MNNDLLYQLALTQIPNIGDVQAKTLVNFFGDAVAIFKAPKKQLEQLDGIGTVRAHNIKSFSNFAACETEIAFIEKYKITPLFIADKNYPQRLLNCYDSPTLLFYRGNADLNSSRMIAVVGTRSNSDYGKHLCEKIIEDLQQESIIIISGLAYGIDTIAHKAALKNNLPTVGVVAHGLDRIYPSQNKHLAKDMIANGGLLTDFPSGTKPDKQNFPRRNRIVAGICDALLVIESGIKGGSLITAELANSYNKDVFAIPGKTTDVKSEGCNHLIRSNKASLATSATDILEAMNWLPKEKVAPQKQRELFIELSADQRIIVDLLQQTGGMHIDELYFQSGLSSSAVAAALLLLEMHNLLLFIS
ncbi:MAG: DNA-protecting protein DprA [Chitinophagaceae bacterium]|nr:MAG: DNA-protecting protein DprA [Chitinophagaceae bacterium]